jgi:hypothetical protein
MQRGGGVAERDNGTQGQNRENDVKKKRDLQREIARRVGSHLLWSSKVRDPAQTPSLRQPR